MLIVANIVSFHLVPHFPESEKVSCHCDSPTDFERYFCPFFRTCAPLTDDIISILGPNVMLATLLGPSIHTLSICTVSPHSAVWYVSYFIAKLSLISGVNPTRTGCFATDFCRARTQSKTPLSQKFKVVHSCSHCNLYCCFTIFWIQKWFLVTVTHRDLT